jgi:hypothetical protein
MGTVKGGNTYETNVTYNVTDATGLTVFVQSPATIKIAVIAESTITANFINKTINVAPDVVTQFNVLELVATQLGHPPFTVFVDQYDFSDPNMSDWVTTSPTTRLIIVNFSAQVQTATDLSTNNTISTMLGGGGSSLATRQIDLSGDITTNLRSADGTVFDAPVSTPPATGSYTITLKLRVVDSLGLSTSGTSIVTLNVP